MTRVALVRFAGAAIAACLLPSVVWGEGTVALASPGMAMTVETAAEAAGAPEAKPEEPIDFVRARELMLKRRRGGALTPDEEAYLQRAIEARRQGAGRGRAGGVVPMRDTSALKPLTEMTAEDRYKGEDGGLYGEGRNTPPDAHRKAAEAELARIRPLDAQGKPAEDGKIVLVSISMSNATQEFSAFKRLADADPAKSDRLTIVDCAQGGQAMAEWADPKARPWDEAQRRLADAGMTPQQVQLAWVKLANKGPRGDLREHGKPLQRDTLAVLQNAKARFPNLRIAYLSSRIYAGYAGSPLNPEPYAYESALVVRWLIQDQIAGNAELSFGGGTVKAPLLLWGPYLWANGTTPRRGDGLVWKREDLAGDGTHPSASGRAKVAQMLLDFFRNDPLAKPWFRRSTSTSRSTRAPLAKSKPSPSMPPARSTSSTSSTSPTKSSTGPPAGSPPSPTDSRSPTCVSSLSPIEELSTGPARCVQKPG